MGNQSIFDTFSSAMTLISFITFLGILVWTWAIKSRADFDQAARLPFADDAGEDFHG